MTDPTPTPTTTAPNWQRVAEKMKLIVDDCRTDALALDGAPLTGLTMGENFGNLYAMVQAVARAVEALAREQRS